MAFPPYGATVPDLDDYQFSFNGVVFGGINSVPNSLPYPFISATGLGDLPTLATGDVQRPRDYGEMIGLDLLAGRDITIQVAVVPSGGYTMPLKSLELALAFPTIGNVEAPLWFQLPGWEAPFGVMARVRKRSYQIATGYVQGQVALVTLQFHCTDPRLYLSPTLQVVNTSGSVVITNEGGFEMRPLLIFAGADNAQATNASISGEPTIYTAGSFTTLEIDTDFHSFLGNSAPAPNAVAPNTVWWNLPGSSENTIEWSGASSLTIQYAPAYDGI